MKIEFDIYDEDAADWIITALSGLVTTQRIAKQLMADFDAYKKETSEKHKQTELKLQSVRTKLVCIYDDMTARGLTEHIKGLTRCINMLDGGDDAGDDGDATERE